MDSEKDLEIESNLPPQNEDSDFSKTNEADNVNDKKEKMKKGDKIFVTVVSTMIFLLVTYFILFSTVFYYVTVSGRSMKDTLESGDILIVNKVAQPDYGDVIIVSGLKTNGDWLIKRVIGLEGDTITINQGKVYLNGEELCEDYAKGLTYAPDCTNSKDVGEMTYVVSEGEVFFLGDNREDSLDSRFYGVCSLDDVEGVVSEFAIKIKGITTPINAFKMKVKNFLGFKS